MGRQFKAWGRQNGRILRFSGLHFAFKQIAKQGQDHLFFVEIECISLR